jgi:hypothetical protein
MTNTLPVMIGEGPYELSIVSGLCRVLAVGREAPRDVVWLTRQLNLVYKRPEVNELTYFWCC